MTLLDPYCLPEARPVRHIGRKALSQSAHASQGRPDCFGPWPLLFDPLEPRHEQALPVALVPNPAVASCLGTKVGPAQVVDLRGEAQEAPVSVGPVHAVGRLGEAVFLMGTVQLAEWAVLQVGCVLH